MPSQKLFLVFSSLVTMQFVTKQLYDLKLFYKSFAAESKVLGKGPSLHYIRVKAKGVGMKEKGCVTLMYIVFES